MSGMVSKRIFYGSNSASNGGRSVGLWQAAGSLPPAILTVERGYSRTVALTLRGKGFGVSIPKQGYLIFKHGSKHNILDLGEY